MIVKGSYWQMDVDEWPRETVAFIRPEIQVKPLHSTCNVQKGFGHHLLGT